MKKNFYFLISLFALIFSSLHNVDAQTNPDWKLLLLDVAGRTMVNGVEVYAQGGTCKDNEVVYVKFVNHNSYPVIVKWFDAVLTQDQKWIKKENQADKKSIIIDANKEIVGECLTNNYIECIIKLKDFIDKPTNFKEYAVYHFEVAEVVK